MMNSPPLEIVCSPPEHHDSIESAISPFHSLLSDSDTTIANSNSNTSDIETTLTDLERVSSELLPAIINIPSSNLAITMVNEHFSSASPQINSHSPYANALENLRPGTPSSHSEQILIMLHQKTFQYDGR